jgi:hypothetical protein
MATNKRAFLLYSDLIETAKILPKELQAGLFMMILEYVNDLNPETDNLALKVAFEPVKQSLKRDLNKYKDIQAKRSAAGKIGGSKKPSTKPAENKQSKAKKANGSKSKQVQTSEAVNGNVNENVNESVLKRKELFKKQVFKHTTFKEEMLLEFFNYWSEHSERGKKMRYEKQPTFDVNLRLHKWHDNQIKWEKENPNKKRTASKDWKDLVNQQK